MPSSNAPFVPPYCPSPQCDSHGNPAPWRYVRKGFYPRPLRGDRVQRYRCSHCGRSFSSQTFSPTYWLRRPDLLTALFFRTRACSGLRQIAHELGVSHSTVQRQVERLGRHCLLFHERLRPQVPSEPLVLDGLRTFEAGQYWPYDLNLVVGESHYVYGFNDAELRRSGTMTPSQRRRRLELEGRHGRPDPNATEKAVVELLGRLLPDGVAFTVRSDEHPAYARAVRRLRDRRIRHETTSSRASRTPRNPLFPVNLADLLLRHGSANHKRETIAFSKRRQGALYRLAIWTVWRNYVKSSSERTQSPPPSVQLGITPRRLTVEEILDTRLFPWHVRVEGWLGRCYRGEVPTRCLPRNRRHACTYAV